MAYLPSLRLVLTAYLALLRLVFTAYPTSKNGLYSLPGFTKTGLYSLSGFTKMGLYAYLASLRLPSISVATFLFHPLSTRGGLFQGMDCINWKHRRMFITRIQNKLAWNTNLKMMMVINKSVVKYMKLFQPKEFF